MWEMDEYLSGEDRMVRRCEGWGADYDRQGMNFWVTSDGDNIKDFLILILDVKM